MKVRITYGKSETVEGDGLVEVLTRVAEQVREWANEEEGYCDENDVIVEVLER
tara:strand:+ start:475 stop:633 length:159 start_codon:yes stop_codon:yes gene_type:complete